MSIYLPIECDPGSEILQASTEAIALANRINCNVDFKFNNVTCFARVGGDPELLTKNYHQAIESKGQYKFAHSRPTQDVVSKGWEILKIGKDSSNYSMWKENIQSYLDGTLHDIKNTKILEVKRLSDSVVFCVGDLLCGLGFHQDEIHEIKSIYPINGTLGFEYGNEGAIIIQSAKKAPQSTEPPPLGVMPEWLWKELRLQEIDEAMTRYTDDKKAIPLDWVVEKHLLTDWLKNRDEDKGWAKNFGMFIPHKAIQMFTEKQLLDAEQKAFDAAKVIANVHVWCGGVYRTFSDYKNSQK